MTGEKARGGDHLWAKTDQGETSYLYQPLTHSQIPKSNIAEGHGEDTWS